MVSRLMYGTHIYTDKTKILFLDNTLWQVLAPAKTGFKQGQAHAYIKSLTHILWCGHYGYSLDPRLLFLSPLSFSLVILWPALLLNASPACNSCL